MTRRALPVAIALAACSFDLQGLDLASDLVELQLTPAGAFGPSDGRPMDVPAWRIDAAIAAQVIARFQQRRNPAVIDYEHQTLHKDDNGQPAPAAAWIRELVWHEGRGLYARAELTERAKALIQAKEYRYLSPVFHFHPKTGDVLAIEMAALTNTPAIDGMDQLTLRAAATFGAFTSDKDPTMKSKLHLAVCMALALNAETTDEDAATAALNARLQADPLAALRKPLGLADDADQATVVAACTALRAKADAAGNPDPAKFVPIAVVTDLQTQVATLSAAHTARQIDDLVNPALADGRLLPAQEGWARDLGKSNLAALSAYLKTAPKIGALEGTQTGGRQPPAGGDEHGLTQSELAVCTATGVSPEDFKKAKVA